jgi:hypothetical protein
MKVDGLKAAWGCPIVARQQIGQFSGGVLTPGTMANLDCLGKGPEGRFRIGKKVCYPVDSLIAWIDSRTEEVG